MSQTSDNIEWAVEGDEVHLRKLRPDEIMIVMSAVGMLQRRRWGEQCQSTTDDQLVGGQLPQLPMPREDGQ